MARPVAAAKAGGSKQVTSREVFDLYDKEGKKSISTANLGPALRAVGKRLTEEQVLLLKGKAESEFKGALTFDQFDKYVQLAREIEKRDVDIEAAFQVFDNGDNKGLLNVEQMRHALTTLGDKMTLDEIDTVLKDAGGGDDTINYKAIMKLIQSIA